jgi:HupE/UreJ protein
MRGLAALALVHLLVASAGAHPLEPSLLELHESDRGVDVTWTTPARRVPGAAPRVVLPEGCRSGEPQVSEELERIVARWTADCGPGGLAGRRIGVTDLAEARSEVLVRIAYGNGRTAQGILSTDAPEMTVPAEPRRLDLVAAYVRLGIHHILAGTDHLAFVLGLLLLVGGRSFLPAITAFTVGHSVTLSLAVLGLVHVPQRPIEVLIAASVFVLALELVRGGTGRPSLLARTPWLMAGVFGLLHGFGFAGALSDVGLPAGDVPLALGSFNVGIELGQLAVVLPVLIAAHALRGRSLVPPSRWHRLLPAYAIGSLAFCWILERAATLLG